eukprot:gb/GFBE01028661.1/.p1 GENE.gb/GFBE01028661.1/~~gb/GFBE01028661.1/.p1  ORF type:complete len:366 (+),score=81.30 gb/GFBE01028661.1/:1-1098(+)
MPTSDARRFHALQGSAFSLEEHHEWAAKMWRRMDRDGSGSITRQELDCEEFRAVIRSVLAPTSGAAMGGVEYARAEMNMSQAINFCLRKADLNGDASLSFEEFKSFLFILRHQDFGRSTAHLIFSLFDLDQDAYIDENEFREIYRFFQGHKPTEQEFQDEWGRLDCKGDQKVDVHRYIDWLKSSQNPVFSQHAPKPPPEMQSPTDSVMTSSSKYLPRMTKSGASTFSNPRPRWNQRFNAGANKNDCCPQGQRNYFTKVQSLPELKRYYETHRGFRDMAETLAKPEVKPKPAVLSTEKSGEISLPRSKPGLRDGWMRNPVTGKRELWEDHWQTPKAVRQLYQPGTLSFRCPGSPPKWMISDPYDDE